MLFTPLFKTIDHFKERNYEAVASVATDLLNSSPESNQEQIKQSNETITLFSFANKNRLKQRGSSDKAATKPGKTGQTGHPIREHF